MRSLHRFSYSHCTSLDTERSKQTLSFHGSTRKKLITENTHSRLQRTSYILKILGIRIFIHCTGTMDKNYFHIRWKHALPKISTFIFRSHTFVETKKFASGTQTLPKTQTFVHSAHNTPTNNTTETLKPHETNTMAAGLLASLPPWLWRLCSSTVLTFYSVL
jgi:hypothetical protein